MIGSSCYSFVICRRQLKKLDGADTRIHSVIDNILDGMITVDADGTICAMNPAARKMFGYRESDFVGAPFTQLIPKQFDREAKARPSRLPLGSPGGAYREHHPGAGADSHRDFFPGRNFAKRNDRGQDKFFVAMIRDVTERKRFEEEIAAERKPRRHPRSIEDGVITTDV